MLGILPEATPSSKWDHLSPFGVESDDFPSIDGEIDFVNKKGSCHKWFYDPANKDSTYSFSRSEIDDVLRLLQNSDLHKLKKDYTVKYSDQPTSTLIVTTSSETLTFRDYGLEGDEPLRKIYKIIYKL